MLLDLNHTNSAIWSAVTRPDDQGTRRGRAVHTVIPVVGGPTAVQWYEIGFTPSVTVTPHRITLGDGDWAHDASIAVNANTDIVITFNRSYADPSKYPGIWSAIRPRGGSMTVAEEQAGPQYMVYRPLGPDGQVSPFWADFSGTEPDPVMDCQFWAHHITVHDNPVDPPCNNVSRQWRSWLVRYRVDCNPAAGQIRENLDMDEDGLLTQADLAIFAGLVAEEDPDADRLYNGVTDAWDFLDFLAEWEEPG